MFCSHREKIDEQINQKAHTNHAKRRPDGLQKMQGAKKITVSFPACLSGKL